MDRRPSAVDVTVRVGPDDLAKALRADVRAGLSAVPKVLPPVYLYDDRGSELFDEITRLPEYYPTRAERSILDERAGEIAVAAEATTLVELGSGTSEKTRLLLRAMSAHGGLRRYVPFDVAEETLRGAAGAIVEEFPGLRVHAVVGDFRRDLDAITTGEGPVMLAFLGGTIGNFTPVERSAFLADIASVLRPGDSLLVGTDLMKDPARLVAAYDDAAGVTAAFNLNLLTMLNRELGADFDVDAFDHVARWDPEEEWIEMRLRARSSQTVTVAELDLTVAFGKDEDLRTEISAKFRPERVEAEIGGAGFRPGGWWTDAAGDFALSRWVR